MKNTKLSNVLKNTNLAPSIHDHLSLTNRAHLYGTSKALHNLDTNIGKRSAFLSEMKLILNSNRSKLTNNRAQKMVNHLKRLQKKHTPENAQRKILDSFQHLRQLPWRLSIYSTFSIGRYGRQINDANMQHLSTAIASGALPVLEELDLHNNNIGDSGLTSLANVRLPDRLHTINLSFNQIGDDGMKALAKAALPALSDLRLQSNNIGDKGMIALSEALGMRAMASITFIDLDDNQATEAGKKAMRDVAELRRFRVDLRDQRPAGWGR